MYIEIISPALCAVAMGLSYRLYREAKRVSDLSTRAADIARLQCKDSALYALASKNTLREVVASAEISNDAATRADASLKGTVTAGTNAITRANEAALLASGHAMAASVDAANSARYSASAESFKLMAKEHVIEAAEQVEMAACHVQTAQAHVETAKQHVERAAEHAAKTDAHASSVGALSRSIADIAAQTKVRLVHRTDYSTLGSNIVSR